MGNVKLTNSLAIENKFITIFSGLMGECATELSCLDFMLVRNEKCLLVQQQKELIRKMTHEKIKDAINSMSKEKAPGVDGSLIEFFTKN